MSEDLELEDHEKVDQLEVPKVLNVADLAPGQRNKLFQILKQTQCPLEPRVYSNEGKLVSAYYFNNQFWELDDELKQIISINVDSNNITTYKSHTAKMKLVDQYLGSFRLQSSDGIYKTLDNAHHEVYNNISDGDDDNDFYHVLIPTLTQKIMFLSVFFTLILNGYFITQQTVDAINNQQLFEATIMKFLALFTAIIEAILFLDVGIASFGVSFVELFIRLCQNKTVYIQTKRIAFDGKELSTLSLLRYMPSIEIMTNALFRFGENITELRFAIKDELKRITNIWSAIFVPLVFFTVSVAPIFSFMSLLIKIRRLEFLVNNSVTDWNPTDILAIVGLFNQISGIRVLRNYEESLLQHFVFSGNDAKLDYHEILLRNEWWDLVLISAVSNLEMTTYELIVFWYGLGPIKLQLLLKDHNIKRSGLESLKITDKALKDVLKRYDARVYKTLMEN